MESSKDNFLERYKELEWKEIGFSEIPIMPFDPDLFGSGVAQKGNTFFHNTQKFQKNVRSERKNLAIHSLKYFSSTLDNEIFKIVGTVIARMRAQSYQVLMFVSYVENEDKKWNEIMKSKNVPLHGECLHFLKPSSFGGYTIHVKKFIELLKKKGKKFPENLINSQKIFLIQKNCNCTAGNRLADCSHSNTVQKFIHDQQFPDEKFEKFDETIRTALNPNIRLNKVIFEYGSFERRDNINVDINKRKEHIGKKENENVIEEEKSEEKMEKEKWKCLRLDVLKEIRDKSNGKGGGRSKMEIIDRIFCIKKCAIRSAHKLELEKNNFNFAQYDNFYVVEDSDYIELKKGRKRGRKGGGNENVKSDTRVTKKRKLKRHEDESKNVEIVPKIQSKDQFIQENVEYLSEATEDITLLEGLSYSKEFENKKRKKKPKKMFKFQ